MNIYEFYIPWSPEILLDGIAKFLGNFGVIVNAGIWLFLVIAGIAFIAAIVNKFTG